MPLEDEAAPVAEVEDELELPLPPLPVLLELVVDEVVGVVVEDDDPLPQTHAS